MFDFEKFEAMVRVKDLDILYKMLDDLEQADRFLAYCGDVYAAIETKIAIIEVEIDNRKNF